MFDFTHRSHGRTKHTTDKKRYFWFAAAAFAIGAFTGAQSAGSQASAAAFNRDIEKRNALLEIEKAKLEEGVKRRETASLLSEQQALFLKSGVDIGSGSPLEVITETAGLEEFEAQIIKFGGELKSKAALARAAQFEQQAKAARKRKSLLLDIGTAVTFGAVGLGIRKLTQKK